MARLASPNPSRPIPVLESLTAHLQDLFNSSQGGCNSPHGAGLPPIVDLLHDFPRAVTDLETAISETIRLLEPRLDTVQVTGTHLKEEGKIHIHIQGRLANAQDQDVELFSELDQRGRLRMQ